MPRYFFHVLNNRAIIDTQGAEYPGVDAAREAAVRTAGEIVVSEGTKFWQNDKWRMAVADETGRIILTLDFSATIHDEP